MPSEPEEVESEDVELQAATHHLTEDFLCQVIQEEEVRGMKGDPVAEPEKESMGPHRQAASLTSILGKLPSAASLSLQQTFQTSDTSESGEKDLGEDNDCNRMVTSPLDHRAVRNQALRLPSGDHPQSEELDLEGIDDQEIDKVSSQFYRYKDT